MFNFLVITGSCEEALQFVLMGRELLGRNIVMHIVCARKHVHDFVVKQGWEKCVFVDLQRSEQKGDEDVFLWMRKYKNPTIAEMIHSEQSLKSWSLEDRFKLLKSIIKTYEGYFDQNQIKAVVKFPTCSLIGRAAFSVARRRALPTFIINTGPIVTKTFTLNDMDEGWLWSEFFDQYNHKIGISDSEKKMVEHVIDQIMLDKKESIQIRKANVLRTGHNAVKYIFDRMAGKADYVATNEIKKEVAFFFGSLLAPIKYSKLDKTKPYIFFPLHVPWDAQIATRNPMFYSQEAVFKMISRSCPAGVTLYVKEHPYFAGGVNRYMFKDLKQFPNIKVLDPKISSLEIIKHASSVVVVNSTAGWEAILLKKPVIILGNPFYAYFKGSYKIDNINSLPKKINEALSEGCKAYEDEDEWYKFIYCAVASAHKGSMVRYKNYMGLGKDLSLERIKGLCDVFELKLIDVVLKTHTKGVCNEKFC